LSAAEHFDYGSGAPVNVVEPDDIIFTEKAAGLHLDPSAVHKVDPLTRQVGKEQ
jgi:hypothetical protein